MVHVQQPRLRRIQMDGVLLVDLHLDVYLDAPVRKQEGRSVSVLEEVDMLVILDCKEVGLVLGVELEQGVEHKAEEQLQGRQ